MVSVLKLNCWSQLDRKQTLDICLWHASLTASQQQDPSSALAHTVQPFIAEGIRKPEHVPRLFWVEQSSRSMQTGNGCISRVGGRRVLSLGPTVPLRGFHWERSCDFAQGPQAILKAQAEATGGQSCVFRDIKERLAEKIGKEYDHMLPAKRDELSVRAQKTRNAHSFLRSVREDAFARNCHSECIVHKRMCPSNALAAMLAVGPWEGCLAVSCNLTSRGHSGKRVTNRPSVVGNIQALRALRIFLERYTGDCLCGASSLDLPRALHCVTLVIARVVPALVIFLERYTGDCSCGAPPKKGSLHVEFEKRALAKRPRESLRNWWTPPDKTPTSGGTGQSMPVDSVQLETVRPWWLHAEAPLCADEKDALHMYLCRLAGTWDTETRASFEAMDMLNVGTPDKLSDKRPLVMSWGSTVCHGYSSLGKHEKEGNVAAASSHDVWLEERRVLCERGCEDLFFHENSPNYPADSLLAEGLKDTHEVRSITIKGTQLGLPYGRNRKLTCGWNRKVFVWKGTTDIVAEFAASCGHSLNLDGDAYLVASDRE
eukprot:6492760-Amphidinium_carterae.7